MVQLIIQNNYTYVHKANGFEMNLIDWTLRFRPEGYIFAPSYKAGKWDGYIRCFERSKGIFQTGLIDQVIEKFEEKNVKYQITDERIKPNKKVNLMRKKDIPNLRPYQKEAVDAFLQKHRGIINIPTGTGKTVVAMEIIDRLQFKTLFITPNTVIMHQVADIFSNIFGETKVGVIYGKKKQTKRKIVVACVASLEKLDEDFFNDFDLVILDEFHHCLFGGSKIKTNQGVKTIKQIVENKINCSVLSYNIKNKSFEYKKVTNFFKYNCPEELIEIKYETKNKKIKTLICTENHKIYTSNRGYILASQLTTDDDVIIEKPFICSFCNKQHKTMMGLGGCVNSHITPKHIKQQQAKKMRQHPNWNSKNARKLNSLSKIGDKNPAKRKEVRLKKSISQKKWWNSLSIEEQNKRTKIFINAPQHEVFSGPTKLEKRIIDLNMKDIIFTGNGNFWLTSNNKKLNPDFKIKNQKKVIEVGDVEYWHTLEDIQQRIEDLNKINFQCLYLTNRDLNKLTNKQLIKTIKEFINV